MRRSTVLTFVLLSSPSCNAFFTIKESDCHDARKAVETLLAEECETEEFRGSAMCSECVSKHGLYSIDDTCTCQPLVFDSDSCLYRSGNKGRENVRAALSHAADICVARDVGTPWESGRSAGGAGGAEQN